METTFVDAPTIKGAHYAQLCTKQTGDFSCCVYAPILTYIHASVCRCCNQYCIYPTWGCWKPLHPPAVPPCSPLTRSSGSISLQSRSWFQLPATAACTLPPARSSFCCLADSNAMDLMTVYELATWPLAVDRLTVHVAIRYLHFQLLCSTTMITNVLTKCGLQGWRTGISECAALALIASANPKSAQLR